MSVKRSLVILFLLMFVLPVVLAATTTPITVYAPANHQLTITALDPNQVYYSYQSFLNKDTGGTGEVVVSFDSDQPVFDIALLLKQNGQKVKYYRFQQAFPTGKAIVMDFTGEQAILGAPVVVENITESVVENVTEDNSTLLDSAETATIDSSAPETENKSSGKISGSFVTNIGLLFSNTKFYIIGGVVILALVVVIFGLSRGISDPFKEFASRRHQDKVKSLEIIPRSSSSYVSPSEQVHQRKIRDNEIKDAEHKLDEARRALERLKR